MGLRDLLDRAGGITRRAFAKGAVATGAATVAAITLSGCQGSRGKSSDGEPQVVTDSSQVVSALDDYESADLGVTVSQTWTLPVGTVLFHCEGSYAAAMLAPESAVHPNTLGALALSSGALATLMEDPLGGRDYAFHDVRCADGVFSWLEIRYDTCAWTLYGRALYAGALTGEAVKLDEGDSDWDPPMFTCTGSSVIWLKMPSTSGSKTAETSTCYLWTVGDDKGQGVWDSTGRFATHPRVSNGILTLTPRVRGDEGTYYGMTAIDLTDGSYSKLDQLVLPASVKPFDAVYTGTQFAFSIEASYDSAGSLGQMGTFIGREGGPYVYFGREPSAQVAYSGTRFLIKTQSAHYVVDTEAKQLQGISSPDRSLGVGDFPASEGAAASPLVFATIRDIQGIPTNVTARVLAL